MKISSDIRARTFDASQLFFFYQNGPSFCLNIFVLESSGFIWEKEKKKNS